MTYCECRTPDCTNTGGYGWLRVWCRRCSARLAEVRAAFELDETRLTFMP